MIRGCAGGRACIDAVRSVACAQGMNSKIDPIGAWNLVSAKYACSLDLLMIGAGNFVAGGMFGLLVCIHLLRLHPGLYPLIILSIPT